MTLSGGGNEQIGSQRRRLLILVIFASLLSWCFLLWSSSNSTRPRLFDNKISFNSGGSSSSSSSSGSSVSPSPYEEIWITNKLPFWAKKKPSFQVLEPSISPNERICFVHVGKAGGSSVGCALGFSLHCGKGKSLALEGLLPQRTTRMFHADTYDCHDDSAYFLFVVRDPLSRIRSAFLYERPISAERLRKNHPLYYKKRKNLYLDCPFYYFEDFVQRGMRKHGNATEQCKVRAFQTVWGTRHYSCHFYFNYQFHLEGVPEEADLLVIRNEHLVHDYNVVEEYIGGQKDIIGPNETIPVRNKNRKSQRDQYMSEESRMIVCKQLCNEILAYKRILHRAMNLNEDDVAQSMEELRKSCPKEADLEECPLPPPDIRQKLIQTRGYKDKVMLDSFLNNAEKLERYNHKDDDDVDQRDNYYYGAPPDVDDEYYYYDDNFNDDD